MLSSIFDYSEKLKLPGKNVMFTIGTKTLVTE